MITHYPADPDGTLPYAPVGAVFLTPQAARDAAVYYSSYEYICSALGVYPGRLRKIFLLLRLYAGQSSDVDLMVAALREYGARTLDRLDAEALVQSMERTRS